MALSQVLWSLAFKFFWVTGGIRRAARAHADPAGRPRDAATPAGQARLPLPPVLLLRARALRGLRGGDVGHRALALRQGAPGHPRQRDAGGVRGVQVWRYRWVAFLVSGIYHRARRRPLGAAQRPHHAGHPALDVLGQDRVLHRAGGLPDLRRPHRRRHRLQLPRDLRGRPHRVLADGAGRRAGGAGARPARGHRGHGCCRLAAAVAEGLERREHARRHRQLAKSFGETHAVDHVDFAVTEGEVLALIGSNGAGKTTLVNLISGLIPPDSGRIIRSRAPTSRARPCTRRSSRHRAELPAREPLRPAHAASTMWPSPSSRAKARPAASSRSPAPIPRVRDEALEVLRAFGLDGKAGVPAGGLSQGERKLLDIAVAYALKPDAPLPRRAHQRGEHAGEGAHHGHHHRHRALGAYHRGDHRARHGRGLHATASASWPCTRGRSSPTARPDEIRANAAGDRQPARHPGPMTAASMLELEGVNTFRGPAQVLRDVSPARR